MNQLILRRRAMISALAKSPSLVFLEYIQSTGTQWINSGVKDSNPNLTIEVTFSDIGGSGYRYILGCWEGDSINNTVVYINQNGDIGAWVNHPYTDDAMVKGIDLTAKHTVRVDNTGYYLDGELVYNSFPSGIQRTGGDLYIFKRNGAGGTAPQATSIYAKMYRLTITDGSTPVRDYVPAKKNDEVGLYDLVNHVFYGNDGTGNFIAGPAIGYQPVEYLIGDGKQYVNTDYFPNNLSGIYINASTLNTNDSGFVGCRQSVNTDSRWFIGTVYSNRTGIITAYGSFNTYEQSQYRQRVYINTPFEYKLNYMNNRKRICN